ncbi:hypothetical protein Y032_0219g2467 [Ancylostoma ceylanicum]|uniref:Uncharacterized protein n=1 Tax=Ancylostoma ceylanicum TaxID=53326 RepID=A0A016SJF5_9BILA|nr:hypothetical protein Y032_0219g2467 [Ancylostoma ceylanicum]
MSFHLNIFNLNSLEGDWRDIHNETQFFSRGYIGGDTVIVWSGFCPKGRLDIAFILTCVTASDYSEVFRVQLLLLFFQNQEFCSFSSRATRPSTTVVRRCGMFVDNTVTVMASLTCQGSCSDRGR